jgi:rubrerythrin
MDNSNFRIEKTISSTRTIVANITATMSDQEILNVMKNCPCGEYAHWICKNCGYYITSARPPFPTKIVTNCYNCRALKDENNEQ